jgi:hypothetical protein
LTRYIIVYAFFPDITISGNLGIKYNFEQNCSNSLACYAAASAWQNLFGSVAGTPVNGEDKSYQTRSFGLYADENGLLRAGGSYLNRSGSANIYGSEFNSDYSSGISAAEKLYYGTFLIKSDLKTMASLVNVAVVDAPHIHYYCLYLVFF